MEPVKGLLYTCERCGKQEFAAYPENCLKPPVPPGWKHADLTKYRWLCPTCMDLLDKLHADFLKYDATVEGAT